MDSMDLPQNPFYCPALPASAYISSLSSLSATSTFAKILCRTFLPSNSNFDTATDDVDRDECVDFGTPSSGTDDEEQSIMTTVTFEDNRLGSVGVLSMKRKRSDSTGFDEVYKHGAIREKSFDGTRYQRPRLQTATIAIIEHETEPPIPESNLFERLTRLIPGIWLPPNRTGQSHIQAIITSLAQRTLLIPAVLLLIRTCEEITELDLGSSLDDADGLNIGAVAGAARILGMPGSFVWVGRVVLTGCVLDNGGLGVDLEPGGGILENLARLPRLAILEMEGCGVGNEGIYTLLPLARTVHTLLLTANPRINDDAVPALLLLRNLTVLALVGTGVGMRGLRKMAEVIESGGRVVDVEIPQRCEDYVDGMAGGGYGYTLHIRPPLVDDPKVVDRLSGEAIRRNLRAHGVVGVGTKSRDMERLRDILTLRRNDLRVRAMVCEDKQRCLDAEVVDSDDVF